MGATDISEEITIPSPIRRNGTDNYMKDYYYASEKSKKSIKIQVNGTTIDVADIVVCDLTDWKHSRPPDGKVAIDPVLGRILLPKPNIGEENSNNKVHVSLLLWL